MGILSRGKKEKSDEQEYLENVALTEEGRQQADPERYIDAMGPIYHFVKDDQVTTLLWMNPRLRNLVPAFSHLNRLGNIDAKEQRIQRLKYKVLLLKEKGYMNTKTYAKGGSTLISSLGILSRSIPNDSFHGWKGRITTERTKVIRTILEKKKKRSVF